MIVANYARIACACWALLSLQSVAQAAPVDLDTTDPLVGIYYGSFAQNNFPTPQNEQAIYMPGGTNTTSGWGSVGANDSTHDVFFSSPTALDFANGFAKIDGYDESGSAKPLTYNELTVTTPGATFRDFIFRSINASDVTIKAYDDTNTLIGNYSFTVAPGTGQPDDYNRIMVLAEGGALFTRLVLSSADGWGTIEHIDISGYSVICTENCGGGGGNPPAVPIPSAFILFGSALAGLGILGMRRRRTLIRA